ncbi:exosortase A [Ferribacterium limneticum]|uniref:exosortase A n=1 Tax=Ferribacterium limneticum TaxID=76259 RepID=UPI001CF919AB|nr:exosortase A [Ferribacterium limneticum]UCV24742.1 exosortase A [Ferribacterium limneticum]
MTHRPNWKPTLAAIALTLLWIGYWYWGTLEAMAQIWWRSETYAHGLIVPPIALWLIWRDRQRPVALAPHATLWFAMPLAGFVFLWLLGDLTAVNALTQFAVIGLIVVAIMALVGWPISKVLAFPLLFLFFAVPVGDFLLPRLMEWTADFTVLALRLTGIPVFREGQNFVIPSGNWSVVEACSGVRYLIASLTVGTLYAYLTYTSLKRRLIFILVSLLVPILANWLRAYMIVMLGHFSGNKLAVGADHLIYGWVFFGIVIVIMFAIGARWAEPIQTAQRVTSAPGSKFQKPLHTWTIMLILAVVIAAGSLYEMRLRQANTDAVINLALPATAGSWHTEAPAIEWQPRFTNPSAELHSAYRNQDGWVGLYIAYYQNQNYERKLVTSTNVLVTSSDPLWQIVANRQANTSFGGSQVAIREAELLKKQDIANERYIIWQGYWINGRLTSSDIEAKWLTAWAMLTGHGDDSAAIIIYAPKDSAAKDLPAFANEAGGEILRSLTEARLK